MSPHSAVRIAVIGAGKMTMKRHLPALARLRSEGLCELVGICDINLAAAQTAGDTYAIPFVTHNAAELIAKEDIDAVCIFGPADVHYTYGLLALRAGKHLFVEKPPAPTTAQLQEMSAVALQHKRVAVAGFNRRFQRNIVEVQTRIPSGSILSAEAIFHKPNANTPAPFGMPTWLGVSAIHALDVLCVMMGGRPTALWSTHNGGAPGRDENFSAIVEWGTRHAIFSANNSAGSRSERYAFHGYGVSYVIEGSKLTIERPGAEDEYLENQGDSGGGIYEEFRAFVDAIASGAEPIHSLHTAVATLHLVELLESGHRGVIDWSTFEVVPTGEILSAPIVMSHAHTAVEGRPGVLVLNPEVIKNELPLLHKHCDIVYEKDLETLPEDVRGRVTAIITGGGNARTPESVHFALLPNLSALCVVGASVKRWGGAEALARGMTVMNTADVYADAVAEFIVMQALVGLRRASVSHEVLRTGGWDFSVPKPGDRARAFVQQLARVPVLQALKKHLSFARPLVVQKRTSSKASTRTLHGRTVGMIGFGEITKKAIPLFVAHGCTVLVHSEHLDAQTAEALGARTASLDEVLRADVVSMQRGLSQRTERAFGSQEINALQPGAVFINSGRAALVDTDALVARLRNGDIFACLDVYDEEPLPVHDVLRSLPNVFLTSHLAASIRHVDGLLAASSRILVEKLLAHIAGRSAPAIHGRAHFDNMT